MASHFC